MRRRGGLVWLGGDGRFSDHCQPTKRSAAEEATDSLRRSATRGAGLRFLRFSRLSSCMRRCMISIDLCKARARDIDPARAQAQA